eukprot:UN28337
MRTLKREPVKERQFVSGRLCDAFYDGEWRDVRPIYYRGSGQYVVLEDDYTFNLQEIDQKYLREKVPPTGSWVGHGITGSFGSAVIHKVYARQRYVLIRRSGNEQITGLSVDYDRFIPDKGLRKIIQIQREKAEKQKHHQYHIIRESFSDKNEKFGEVVLPLNAGNCVFTKELQQEMMDESGIFFVNQYEFKERFPTNNKLQKAIQDKTKNKMDSEPTVEILRGLVKKNTG